MPARYGLWAGPLVIKPVLEHLNTKAETGESSALYERRAPPNRPPQEIPD